MLFLLAPPIVESKDTKDQWLQGQLQDVQIKTLFVESQALKTWVQKLGFQGEVLFYNEHTSLDEIKSWKGMLKSTCGYLSDGGFPVLGDPGFELVRLCHQWKVSVRAKGVHSFMMNALLLSGCPGNHFEFLGYLPKKMETRREKLKELLLNKNDQTYIVMETPYRFHYVLEDLLEFFPEKCWLSISLDLGTEQEKTTAQEIKDWRRHGIDFLSEKPLGVFVFHMAS